MMRFGSNKILLKIKRYIMANWGSPFIVGFIVLLVAAVGFSSMFGFPDSAAIYSLLGTLAICAYWPLAAGVSLQLARSLKYQDKNNYGGKVS
jgi:hypothetical protein